MAKRMLQKHKTLFPADPVPTIPENQALPMSLRAYDEQFNCAAKKTVVKKKVTIHDLTVEKKVTGTIDLSKDDDSDDGDCFEDVDNDNAILVNDLLGLVSAEGGNRGKEIKISLSSYNGFFYEGAKNSFEELETHRSFVEDSILRDLVDPILQEYWNMKELKLDIPSQAFVAKVCDILNDKMGLMIYK
jgi:hypothetical protein